MGFINQVITGWTHIVGGNTEGTRVVQSPGTTLASQEPAEALYGEAADSKFGTDALRCLW